VRQLIVDSKWFGRCTALLAATVLMACGGPRSITLSPTPTLDPRQTLLFLRNDSLVRLWAVRFSPDSVSGVPRSQDRSCGSCRVGFALQEVSQPRVSRPASSVLTTVIPLGILGAIIYAIYHWKTAPASTNN
jgi:hypothetical protein